MLVVVVAAVLVGVIALSVGLFADEEDSPPGDLRGPLVSAATGTTDGLTAEEAASAPSISPTPGRVQPSKEEWTELLPQLQRIVADDPGDVNAKRKLALAYYNLGRLGDAAAIYEELLGGQEDAVLRNRLGNTLRDMGDTARAETAYRKAIAADPTLAPPYLNLAELLWRQGKDDEALAVIDEGLGAVPEESRVALERGRQVLESPGQ